MTYERCLRGLQEGADRADAVRQALLGRVGRLLFDPQYQAYRDDLRALQTRDAALGHCLTFPLSRPRPKLTAKGVTPLDAIRLRADEDRLIADVVAFLTRWELTTLVTWDLPVPEGPLEIVPPWLAARVRNSQRVVHVMPTYIIPSRGDLTRMARSSQRATARAIDSNVRNPAQGVAGRPGLESEWASAFRLWFREQSAARYGGRRGLTARLTEAYAELHGCGPDHVKRLRKRYRQVARTTAG
jgi:hypothetical protein